MVERIGFIGLGNMGGKICRRIISQGYSATVFDLNPKSLQAFAETAHLANSTEEVLEKSDVVFLSLPSSTHVESVVESFLNIGVKGKTIIDISTSLPLSTQALAAKVETAGGNYVDCPVGGMPAGAEKGELLAMFGGTKEQYEIVAPIIKTFASNYVYMGGHGCGHMAKLANNYVSLSYVNIYAMIFPLAEKMGLNSHDLFDLLSKGSTNCTMLQFYVPKMIDKTYDMAFALELAHKDLSYCRAMFESFSVPAYSLDGTLAMLRTAIRDGKGKMDYSACIQTMYDFFEGK